MEASRQWAESAGSAVGDLGAPVAGDLDITGSSILQADSRSKLDELLAGHPHRQEARATFASSLCVGSRSSG